MGTVEIDLTNDRKMLKMLRRATEDPKLSDTHLSLLNALIYTWEKQGFIEPFFITRRQLLPFMKIRSPTTYHLKLAELVQQQYLDYFPAIYGTSKSTVKLLWNF